MSTEKIPSVSVQSYDQLIDTIQQSKLLLIDLMSQLEMTTILDACSSSSPSAASSALLPQHLHHHHHHSLFLQQPTTTTTSSSNNSNNSNDSTSSTTTTPTTTTTTEQQYEMVHSILLKNEQETKRLKQHYEDRLRDISSERDQFMREILESKFKLENQKGLIEQFKVRMTISFRFISCCIFRNCCIHTTIQ